MLGYLPDQGVGADVVDASYVVHAAYDEVVGIGGPGQVVDLGTGGSKHVLGAPGLFILEAFVTESWVVGFGRNPEDDVAIIAGRSEDLTLKRDRTSQLRLYAYI